MAKLVYSDIGSMVVSKASSAASKPLELATKATSAVGGDTAPTSGKAIPVFTGSVKLDGEVIWAHLFRNAHNECRAHVAVCFGQNAFGRPLNLSTVSLGGNVVYNRAGGEPVIDPPDAIRFYDGTQTAADPLIVSIEGATKTPAWKGYSYAVLENVILADKYTAEVTDNGSTGAVTISNVECDPFHELDGITLVYDKTTGLSYGIEFPMTGTSNLITTDGCGIINRVPIPNYLRLQYRRDDPDGVGHFYCDSVYPLPCTRMVLIAGYDGYKWEGVVADQFLLVALVDPVTGHAISTYIDNVGSTTTHYEGPGLFKASLVASVAPSSTDILYKLTYAVPGYAGAYFSLRLFDRADQLNVSVGGVLPGVGNIIGTIWNSAAGEPIAYEFGLSDRAPESPFPTSAIGYWTDTAPYVDGIVFARTTNSVVYLAAYHQAGNDAHIYFISHGSGGMDVAAGVVVPDAICTGITYDPATSMIIFSASEPLDSSVRRVYHITEGGLVSTSYSTPNGFNIGGGSNIHAASGTAVLVTGDGTAAKLYNTADGTTTDLYSNGAVTGTPIIDTARSLVYLPTASGILTQAIDATSSEDITLIGLLTDICELRGYDSGDLSFTGLAGQSLRGLKLTASVSATDLINRIGLLYSFIFTETDGKLKFIRRRATDGTYTVDVSLTDADLVEGTAKITAQRNSATKVLTSLELSWIDPDRDFETNSLMVYRTNGIFTGDASVRDDKLSLPLVLDAAQARQLLFESFFAQVEAETLFSVTLPPKQLRIEPGSLLSLDAGGAVRLALVRRVTHRADNNTLDVEAEAFMAQASTDISGSTDGNAPGGPTNGVEGVYVHLDIPLIRTTDFKGGEYAIQYHGLTTPTVTDWDGADLYRSRDGVNFTKIIEYDFAPMTVAKAMSVLTQLALLFAMDTESELIIQVQSGDAALFRTVTYLEQMNGSTLAAYGREGAWEIISWQTVTDNLDGTLTLTNLQRGLYGTHLVFDAEGDANIHSTNDRICILENLKTLSSVYGVVDIGVRESFGVVTPSHDLSGVAWHVMDGISVRPFQVANVAASHTAGASTLEITWDACSTIPGTWRDDGAALAMPEIYSYAITIDTVSAGTFEFTTTATSYTWADYGTELGVNALAQDEITVAVQVVSPVWGDGYSNHASGREA